MKRNRTARAALVCGALALVVSGCIPLAEIEEKIKGVEDGTVRVGPSWPVTLSVPVLDGYVLDVGERLAGFEADLLDQGINFVQSYEIPAIDKEIHPATFSLPERAFDFDPQSIEIEAALTGNLPAGSWEELDLPDDVNRTVTITAPEALRDAKLNALELAVAPTLTITELPEGVLLDIEISIDGATYQGPELKDLGNVTEMELADLQEAVIQALIEGSAAGEDDQVVVSVDTVKAHSTQAQNSLNSKVEIVIRMADGGFDDITFIDFETPPEKLADVSEVVVDSGVVGIELVGLAAGEEGLDIVIFDAGSDEELFRIAIPEDEREMAVALSDLRLTGEVYGQLQGSYRIDPGAEELKMVLTIADPIQLKSARLPAEEAADLLSEHVKLDETVTHTFEWPENVDRSGSAISLSGTLTATGIPEGVEVTVEGDVGGPDNSFRVTLRNGEAQSLDALFNEIEEFAESSDPSVDIHITQVSAALEEGATEVTIDFTQDLVLTLAAKVSMGGAGVAEDADLSFSSLVEAAADVPDIIEGGSLVLTVDNASPLSGRLDLWFSAGNAEASGAPDASLALQAETSGQVLQAKLDREILDLFKPGEEIRVTVALSDITTTHPVAEGDQIVIDAYATIAGRVN